MYRRFIGICISLVMSMELIAQGTEALITLSAEGCASPWQTSRTNTQPLILTAQPSDGYRFYAWSDGNTDNPRVIPAGFTAVSLKAQFVPISAESTDVQVALSAEGCATPWQTTRTNALPLVLTAQPSAGYMFAAWSDGNTDNPRVIPAGFPAVNLKAQFIPIPSPSDPSTPFQVTVKAAGCVSNYTATHYLNDNLTIKAVEDECNTFQQWSDGNTSNPRIVSVTADATYTAIFETVQYTITTTSDNATHGTTEATEEP